MTHWCTLCCSLFNLEVYLYWKLQDCPLNCNGLTRGQFGHFYELFSILQLVRFVAERSQENVVNYKLQTNPYTIHSSSSTWKCLFFSWEDTCELQSNQKKIEQNLFRLKQHNERKIQILTHWIALQYRQTTAGKYLGATEHLKLDFWSYMYTNN